MTEELTLSQIGLIVIVGLMPIIGFIMTITHARKGDTRLEQRWRKQHGLLFWTLLPTFSGTLTALGYIQVLPSLFGLIGVILLASSTLLSRMLHQKHEEKNELRG